jgi:hypothetical protein
MYKPYLLLTSLSLTYSSTTTTIIIYKLSPYYMKKKYKPD